MIDEDKLIEELKFQINNCETYGHSDIYIDLEMAKKWVETIEKKKVGEWIPVEERLPNEEEFEKYYCRNHYAAEFIVMIKGANRPTSLYYKEGVWFDDDNNDYDVIAWRPLPEFSEPYSSGD